MVNQIEGGPSCLNPENSFTTETRRTRRLMAKAGLPGDLAAGIVVDNHQAEPSVRFFRVLRVSVVKQFTSRSTVSSVSPW